MNNPKLSLVNEQSSPLFRIMSVYNIDEPGKRQFDNNICAFHIGNGYVLTIAHTLRTQAGFLKSIDADIYDAEIASKLDEKQAKAFDRYYKKDEQTGKRYLSVYDNESIQDIATILWSIKFDTRWQTLYSKGISKPYMIVQFNEQAFYGDESVNESFGGHYLFDTIAAKHTYLVETELVKAFYEDDIALYKMVGVSDEIIEKIPVIAIDSEPVDIEERMHCLQGSPANEAGRLLNSAMVEGILDHTSHFNDPIQGDYTIKGLRYLIKGYFRFGSSGAPYLSYNEATGQYMANAIQSEASPIQLTIDNNREGNYQFVNAIATPLYNVKEYLLGLLN